MLETLLASILKEFFSRRDMAVTADIENMIVMLTETLGDAAKHDRGTDAAGRRLRKALSDVAKECKVVRAKIQSERNES